MKNRIARLIRKTAIILLVLGTIGSFVLAATAIDVFGEAGFSFSVLLQCLMVTALGGLLLIGFSEVIELINTVAVHTEKTEEDTHTMLVHIVAIYKEGEGKPDLCTRCGAPLPEGSKVCANCHQWK